MYKTEDDGSNATYLKTIPKKASDFGKEMTISDLLPKQYYYIKFYYENELNEREYLFDTDYNIQGNQYYFGTLTGIDITDVTVNYLANSYTEKYLDINYTLSSVLGVDKINYEIQKYNEETNDYETVLSTEEIEPTTTSIRLNMNKKVPISNDGKILFDKRYKLIISPIKFSDETEIDVGSKEYVFDLDSLSKPYTIVKGTRDVENSKIKFIITVYDDDCVSVDGEYSISVCDSAGRDITPEQYKNISFSKTSFKKSFEVEVTDAKLSYSIVISTNIDTTNNGIDFDTYSKTYRLKDISNGNISFGDVTAKANLEQYNQVDLIFADSYNLLEITSFKYTVYDTEGNTETGSISVAPSRIESNGNIYYLITLPTNITENGTYYIQLSGMKNDTLVDTETIEYIFID